jgi:hypothetical protein
MKTLQKMIDECANAFNVYFLAFNKLNEYCEQKYGYTPADVDADLIIDSVFGGAGVCSGMTAKEFREEMRRAMK